MRSPFVTCRGRDSRDAGENGVHFLPIHAGGAFGDGGAVRGVVELRGERAGDEGVHGDVLAGGEFAGLRGEAVGQVDVEVMALGAWRRSRAGSPSGCGLILRLRTGAQLGLLAAGGGSELLVMRDQFLGREVFGLLVDAGLRAALYFHALVFFNFHRR